jgi:hypothetical protein
MALHAAAVRKCLARLTPDQVCHLVSIHADRPFTRRAAAGGRIEIEGLRRAEDWWVLQISVEFGPGQWRTVALTKDRGGMWRCPSIRPIHQPSEQTTTQRSDDRDVPLDPEYVSEV